MKVIFSEHRRRTQGARLSHLSTLFNNVTLPHLLLQRMIVWSLASWHVALARNLSLTCSPILYPHSERVCRPHSSLELLLRTFLCSHTHTVNSTPHDPLLLRSSLAFSLRLRDWAAALVCVCQREPLLLPCSVRSCLHSLFITFPLQSVFSATLLLVHSS